MSYEGYVQSFCKLGHLTIRDDDDKDCCGVVRDTDCTAAVDFENPVNDTNCDEYGVIPDHVLKTLVVTPRDGANDETYSIPRDDEGRIKPHLRYYRARDDHPLNQPSNYELINDPRHN